MKRILLAVLVAVVCSGCISPTQPGAGTEAVLVYKPWFFGHGGVEPTPIKPGLTWIAWSTESVHVNVQPQRVDWDVLRQFAVELAWAFPPAPTIEQVAAMFDLPTKLLDRVC